MKFCVLLLSVALAVTAVSATVLRTNERIVMHSRLMRDHDKTPYMDVQSHLSPRFKQDTMVKFPGIDNPSLVAASTYKISFAFDHERHVTPWFALSDGRGGYLVGLTLVFHLDEFDQITKVTWDPDYSEPDQTEAPATFLVSYRFAQPKMFAREELGLTDTIKNTLFDITLWYMLWSATAIVCICIIVYCMGQSPVIAQLIDPYGMVNRMWYLVRRRRD